MKKTITALLSAAICLLCLLTGCGGQDNSELVGTWTPSTARINGASVQYSDIAVKGCEFQLDFFENGSCEVVIAGTHSTGSYVFNGSSVDIRYDDKTQKLPYESGIITLTMESAEETTVFTFIKAEASALAQAQ